MACSDLFLKLGVKKQNLTMIDSKGVINLDRKVLNKWKLKYEKETTDTLLFKFDKDQMLQVLHNLLQNAQDAINNQSTGIIRIKVSKTTHKKKERILLSIEDNGPGIREEILSKVFDPYTTTKAKGTGLGLPIVRKIIQENNAGITLNNKNRGNGVVVQLLFDRIA